MTDMIAIEAAKRTVVGKKVRHLRRDGLIPVVVYGPDFETQTLQIAERELRLGLREAGGTQIIELVVGKEKIQTLAREVQRDPLRGEIMHVDFYHIDLDRVIRAAVPIVLNGEPPVVTSGEAIVVHLLTAVEVEALPADLPPQIEIDIEGYNEIGTTITLSEIAVPADVEFVTSLDEAVFKIDYAPEIEEEEEEEDELSFMDEGVEVEVISERRQEEDEVDEE